MNPLTAVLLKLLADSPSMTAAMKAGKDVTISARVWRAKTGRWEDLGVVARSRTSWADAIKASWPGRVVLRFKVNGREVERSTW